MKSIVIGYADASRLTAPKIIAGPEISTDKAESIMDDAKSRHIFPDGVKGLEIYYLADPSDAAEFISDEAGAYARQSDEKRVATEKKARLQAAQERDAADSIKKAQGLLTAAASERNKAVANLAAQKDVLASNSADDAAKAAATAKAEKLQPAADAAIAKFNGILAAFNVLKNSKSTVEEKQKALVDLGLKK